MANEKMFKQANELLKDIVQMGDGSGIHLNGIATLEWLIEQAEQTREYINTCSTLRLRETELLGEVEALRDLEEKCPRCDY